MSLTDDTVSRPIKLTKVRSKALIVRHHDGFTVTKAAMTTAHDQTKTASTLTKLSARDWINERRY